MTRYPNNNEQSGDQHIDLQPDLGSLVCFEFRLGGIGKRRGFAHYSCAFGHWNTQVVVPLVDLKGHKCVLCEQSLVNLHTVQKRAI